MKKILAVFLSSILIIVGCVTPLTQEGNSIKPVLANEIVSSITTKESYLVCWRSTHTGYTGNGSPLSYEEASSAVNYANTEFTHIHHWIGEVGKDNCNLDNVKQIK